MSGLRPGLPLETVLCEYDGWREWRKDDIMFMMKH